jgi:hypothetical protein
MGTAIPGAASHLRDIGCAAGAGLKHEIALERSASTLSLLTVFRVGSESEVKKEEEQRAAIFAGGFI